MIDGSKRERDDDVERERGKYGVVLPTMALIILQGDPPLRMATDT